MTALVRLAGPAREPLLLDEINAHLQRLPEWSRQGRAIERTFEFKNYFQTMAFVNAVAWIAHCGDHHPEMVVSYNRCRIQLSTHAIGRKGGRSRMPLT